MCTYNGASYVGEQLASIAAQSRPPDRMVIVDDKSTDGTLAVAERFAHEAAFPVHVTANDRNLGYVKNFERAIRIAEGDLIALSDQDDIWHVHKLSEIEAVFGSSPGAGFVFSDADVVDESLRPVGYRLWDGMRFSHDRQLQVRAGAAFQLLLRRNVVTGATMVFREIYKELVLPIDPGAVHDAWIALLISAVSEQVGMVPEPLMKYRQHGASQIGIRKGSAFAQVVTARNMGRTVLSHLQYLCNVRLRLHQYGGVSPARLELLDDTIEHLRVRASLPDRRLSRLKSVAAEVVSGRYGRLANGFRSAIRDMIV